MTRINADKSKMYVGDSDSIRKTQQADRTFGARVVNESVRDMAAGHRAVAGEVRGRCLLHAFRAGKLAILRDSDQVLRPCRTVRSVVAELRSIFDVYRCPARRQRTSARLRSDILHALVARHAVVIKAIFAERLLEVDLRASWPDARSHRYSNGSKIWRLTSFTSASSGNISSGSSCAWSISTHDGTRAPVMS